MRPKRPLPTACFSSCSVRLRRFCLTTNRCTPASSQARTMRQAVAPARGHRLFGQHVEAGRGDLDRLLRVQAAGRGQHHAVGVGCRPAAPSARRSPAPAWPASRRCSAAGSLSHTATSSACSAWRRTASKWFCAMRPQPTRAKRSLRSMMGGAWDVHGGAGGRQIMADASGNPGGSRPCHADSMSSKAPADSAAPAADENQLIAERREKLAALRRAGRAPSRTTSSRATTPPTCTTARPGAERGARAAGRAAWRWPAA